ncbi:translation initiation factor 3 (IF-3) family protein [Tasmannia lanceolata]|uniref:translation initiation factor 3 (IF-3) family protein n=1 Tax=Tasmannia lanceolata TaxID=3420 RepID=UPI0040647F24
MVFWYRIRPTRFEYYSHQCKRLYSRVYGFTPIDRILIGRIRVLKSSDSFIHQRPTEQYVVSRFFAAPVQPKPKPETKDPNGPRLNRAITADFVRLVTEEGHGIVSRREALDRAMKLNLDLVEVQRNAKPPVCKIMDYHREKYKQQVKEKDRSKGKHEVTLRKGNCKEVHFTGKIEQKDLQTKAEMVKRLMERGYRVKCEAQGKEDEDLGAYLSRLSALIEDVAFVESGPRVEKTKAFVIVRHTKFGPPKKSGKKTSTIMAATPPSTTNSSSPVQMPLQTQEEYEPAESGSGMEDEFISDQEVYTQHSIETPIATPMEVPEGDAGEKLPWSAFDAADDFEKVFNFDDNGNGTTPRFTDRPIDSLDPLSPPVVTDIMDLLNKKPHVVVNESVINKKQEIGSSTISQQHVGPPGKPVFDSIISKLGSGNGQAGRAFNFGEPLFSAENQNSRKIDLKNRFQETKSTERSSGVTGSGNGQAGRVFNFGEPSFSSENQNTQKIDLKNRFQETKSTERSSGVTESKIEVSEFSYATQKVLVNNRGVGAKGPPASEQNSQNRKWQPQPGFNAAKSPEQKVSSTDNSSLRNLKRPPMNENQKNIDANQGMPSSSYGIFSIPKTTASGDQRSSGDMNGDKERNPIKFTKLPNSSGISSDPNPPQSKVGVQRQDTGKTKQGGWGVFSQTEAQR